MSAHALARFDDPVSLEVDIAPALREREAGSRPMTGPEPSQAVAAGHAVEAREPVPLTSLGRHAVGIVAGVRLPPGADGDPALERTALRLIEIGFVQGTRLRVIAFGQPGGDPIGVRIGGRGGISTFALRRQEAACVWVWPEPR
ncbi:MAG: FeoA family protein [Burkholderiaceae bacterium]